MGSWFKHGPGLEVSGHWFRLRPCSDGPPNAEEQLRRMAYTGWHAPSNWESLTDGRPWFQDSFGEYIFWQGNDWSHCDRRGIFIYESADRGKILMRGNRCVFKGIGPRSRYYPAESVVPRRLRGFMS